MLWSPARATVPSASCASPTSVIFRFRFPLPSGLEEAAAEAREAGGASGEKPLAELGLASTVLSWLCCPSSISPWLVDREAMLLSLHDERRSRRFSLSSFWALTLARSASFCMRDASSSCDVDFRAPLRDGIGERLEKAGRRLPLRRPTPTELRRLPGDTVPLSAISTMLWGTSTPSGIGS
eukprot:scaffold129_cov254-Pinguiococcus_pyrenoidosus.AAC.15